MKITSEFKGLLHNFCCDNHYLIESFNKISKIALSTLRLILSLFLCKEMDENILFISNELFILTKGNLWQYNQQQVQL